LFSINTKDLELFFECVDKWLVPKGYLFIVTYNKVNVSNFVVDKSPVDYEIEINDKIIEKIKFQNKKRTNIQYLRPIKFEYYRLIRKIEIPNYSCYLNVYQKN
jgi:hypothetical protein